MTVLRLLDSIDAELTNLRLHIFVHVVFMYEHTFCLSRSSDTRRGVKNLEFILPSQNHFTSLHFSRQYLKSEMGKKVIVQF